MKFLLLGVDPETSERVSLAVRFRWPDANLLVGDLDDALHLTEAETPDLVLIQPGPVIRPTVEIIRGIRAASDVPLIVLEAGEIPRMMDEVAVLEAGADDYVRYSSALLDLVARIVALMRRTWGRDGGSNAEVLSSGPVLLNPHTYEVFIGKTQVNLTLTEFKVLHLLMRNQGRVVTHRFLEQVLWGDHEDSSARVKKYVQRLRQKLGSDGEGYRWIVSVHGVGYRFVGAPEGAPERSDRYMPAAVNF
jgi:two-component system, OmpR family, KDP operon response regulator KdpE